MKREMKREWEEGRIDENSSRIVVSGNTTVTAIDEQRQSVESGPRTVITARRHVRTITTAGHITENAAEPESDLGPDSPDANPMSSNLQLQSQHRHQLRQQSAEQQHRQSQPRNYREPDEQPDQGEQQPAQHFTHISRSDGDPCDQQQQQRAGEQQRLPVVYLTSNGQEVKVEVSETVEHGGTLSVKESTR